MTTMLLATLLFASTGAIANTTTLNEQHESLTDKAVLSDFQNCATASAEFLRGNPEFLDLIKQGYRSAYGIIYHSETDMELWDEGHGISRQEVVTSILTRCLMSPGRWSVQGTHQ